jgi:hypothetical protein
MRSPWKAGRAGHRQVRPKHASILEIGSTWGMRKSVQWSTAFHEAGHVVASLRHGFPVDSATIVPAADVHGQVEHANPLHELHLDTNDSACAYRGAQLAVIVCLSGPAAQRQHNPRSWRLHHGAFDYKRAEDVAISVNTSDEAAKAYVRWLEIVARDEVAASWSDIEQVAGALVERHTLTAAEIAEILRRNNAAPRPMDEESY